MLSKPVLQKPLGRAQAYPMLAEKVRWLNNKSMIAINPSKLSIRHTGFSTDCIIHRLSARRPLACGEVWNIATTLVSIDCAASHDARSPLDGNAWHHRVHADQLWDPECGTVDILDKFMDLMTEAGLVQEAQRFVEGS
jgi:hypothetical protein